MYCILYSIPLYWVTCQEMIKDQVDKLIAQIRTEKYFEAHGIRTPLPARAAPAEAEFEFVDDMARAPSDVRNGKIYNKNIIICN